ncbi:MAG: anthranilate synthase component I [Devosiaceae bacterium]|nr:anthranilate synthase component I [Devosiaceae bacterium]
MDRLTNADDFEGFASGYDNGASQIVWRRVVADLETPVSTYLKLAAGRTNCFMLESVENGDTKGRFSMIGLEPDLILKVENGTASVNRNAATNANAFEPVKARPLDALRALVSESQIVVPKGVPAQSAGLYGYLGYDMVRQMEDLPDPNPDSLNTPDTILMRPTILAVFDTLKDELYLTAPVYPRQGVSARQGFESAVGKIDDALERLEGALPPRQGNLDKFSLEDVKSNTSESEYFSMVKKAKKYVTAGDVFQVVLSQRFSMDFTLSSTALYRALRRTNPSPYMYLLDFEGFSVVGSSPEILVRADKGEVTVRPIAGTRKRGKTPQRDQELADELLSDPKELAEHLMLLDLGRNDVGRVAKTGTVKVTDKFFLEYYSHVMHIVSNVTGQLDETRFDYVDALAAGFPAGTVSGAPKVRAMEIIDELEKERRGIYAGAVGYFGADGYMDTCIVLRTAILKDGKLYVQAGAGIVADSVPELEQLECINKAQALLSAAKEAVRYAGEAKMGQ